MTLTEYPDREMLMLGLADRLAGDLRAALRQRDRVSLAVPGGSTPGPVFDVLADLDLDWARIDVLLTDERWVAPDSPRSNTRLLHERLLRSRAAAARLIPMIADGPTPEAALADLTTGLAPVLPLSVLLLGMGEDMHTASLFPTAPELPAALRADAPPLMALHPPGAEDPRISLTGPVVTGALRTHVLITGAAKRRAIERAAGLPPETAPIRLVLEDATVHWAE